MKKCSECNHEQEQGNFCAKCGGKMEALTEESNVEQEEESITDSERQEATTQDREFEAVTDEQPKRVPETEEPKTVKPDPVSPAGEASIPREPNPTASHGNKDFQQVAGDYWGYAVQLIKNPAQAFGKKEDEYINGLINILIYAATFGLSFYFLVSSAAQELGLGFLVLGQSELPFFKTFFGALIYGLMCLACTVVCLVIFEKIWIKQMSFKEEMAQYGGLLTPLVALNILTILTGLMDFIGITTGLLMLSLFLSTFIIGIIFIYEKITHFQASVYKLYISIGMLLANMFVVYIMLRMIIGEAMPDVEDIFSPSNPW